MGSVSVSHMVLFIASLLVAASVAGTLVTGVDRVSDSMSHQSLDASDRIETDIAIISDTGSEALYDGSNVTVLVKNTGSTTLPPDVDRLDVLLDGQYVSGANLTLDVLDETAEHEWAPGEVASVSFPATLEPGEHRVSVTVNGNEAVVTFRVNS